MRSPDLTITWDEPGCWGFTDSSEHATLNKDGAPAEGGSAVQEVNSDLGKF